MTQIRIEWTCRETVSPFALRIGKPLASAAMAAGLAFSPAAASAATCQYASEEAERADAEAWEETLASARIVRTTFWLSEDPVDEDGNIRGHIGRPGDPGYEEVLIPADVVRNGCSRATLPKDAEWGDLYLRPGTSGPAIVVHFRYLGWIA